MNSPVNINQSVLQSVITERVQQAQQQHETQQRYFEHHLSQETVKKQHKVNEFEDMDYIQLRDKEGRRQRKNTQKGERDENPTDTKSSAVSEHTSKIDIKA